MATEVEATMNTNHHHHNQRHQKQRTIVVPHHTAAFTAPLRSSPLSSSLSFTFHTTNTPTVTKNDNIQHHRRPLVSLRVTNPRISPSSNNNEMSRCDDDDDDNDEQKKLNDNKSPRRDIAPLMEWATQHNITMAPFVHVTCQGEDDDYGMELSGGEIDHDHDDSSSSSSSSSRVILSVPKSLIFDSQLILDRWMTNSSSIRPCLDFLHSHGFSFRDDDAIHHFALVATLLRHRSLGPSSPWHSYIQSLPPSFSTATYFDDVELSLLCPLGLALAGFEREKCRVLCEALDLLPGGDWGMEERVWAYNVVMTRCWIHGDEEDGKRRPRPVIFPMGDMFNHREPPNVSVREEEEEEANVINFCLSSSTTSDDGGLYLSYGLSHNPYRQLLIFGFCDTSTPEIFSEVFVPSLPSSLREVLKCDDRSRMVYRTSDGAISNTVWDAVLYTLLVDNNVEDDLRALEEALRNGDDGGKVALHEKYVMETSLALRGHVVKKLREVQGLLRRMDEIAAAAAEGNDVEIVHPHWSMIRRHNEFLFGVFDKVRMRIDARAKAELEKRKRKNGDDA